MLLVSHHVKPSCIHGLGLFTSEFISAGTIVWRHEPKFDTDIPLRALGEMPKELIETVLMHAEYIEELQVFRLGNDGDIFMNHSDMPSLIDKGDRMIAARDLRPGTELTCDYSDVNVVRYWDDLQKIAA
ncbi:SET domain-containing protein [Thioclava kandeliae]|uniref:SET domain-containing protein n=1 Tax=Thioclava kandeliae TaxID=3070818 RepID=A0ABV1SMC6_9RHOB